MWWCDACGYEIASPGRCAQCTNPLEALPLAELSVGDPMNEVGYTLANWNARARSFLIEVLAQAEIAHRIEDDGELVVSIDDEACVDRIVADLSGSARGTSWLVKSTKGSNEPPWLSPPASLSAPALRRCTQCGSEWTRVYQGTMCPDCGGELAAVEQGDPTAGLSITFKVIDGAGWAPSAGSVVELHVSPRHVHLSGLSKDQDSPPTVLSLRAITDIRVQDQTVVKGGGFMGGGFGLAGAAEGMLAAGLLNAVTTRRKALVTVTISTAAGWVLMQCVGYDPATVRLFLRPFADAAVAARQPSHPADPLSQTIDLAAQLERLLSLHEAGALTEAEFAAAKQKLLS